MLNGWMSLLLGYIIGQGGADLEMHLRRKTQKERVMWLEGGWKAVEGKGKREIGLSDDEGSTSRTAYRYVIRSPPRAPSSPSTRSRHQTDVAVRDPGGTHCITDNGNLDHSRGGGGGKSDLHNHNSDSCSYMLRVQTQNLGVRRSCNIYLFMGSGLWIFIEATPPKPIKVSGNNGDVGWGGLKTKSPEPHRKYRCKRPPKWSLQHFCQEKCIKFQQRYQYYQYMTSVKYIKWCMPLHGTTLFCFFLSSNIWRLIFTVVVTPLVYVMCQIPEIRFVFYAQTTRQTHSKLKKKKNIKAMMQSFRVFKPPPRTKFWWIQICSACVKGISLFFFFFFFCLSRLWRLQA